ncbi:MAG: tRNA lysidine(34) synthetase TilS [Candidatus Sulfotelmatobacter sp.]
MLTQRNAHLNRASRDTALPLYHVLVHSLKDRVLGRIRQEELVRAGDRIGVAVSGGIDSVALLRLLLEVRNELGIVVCIAHFNHQLRGGESDADEEFVAELARKYGLEFYSATGDTAQAAAKEHCGLEAAARELRYGFFRSLVGSGEVDEIEPEPQGLKPESSGTPIGSAQGVPFPIPDRANVLDKIATGHTLDDQAETVLMRLIRGTGLRGLGGIYPRILVEHDDGEGYGEIIRPLLGIRRHELRHYLSGLKQPWREDPTNADSKFTRNRVRKLVLPLIEREFNPEVAESFAELAEIARDEEDYWENEIAGWLGTVVQWSQPEWTRGLPGFGAAQSLVQIGLSQPETDSKLLARIEESGAEPANASVSRPWLLTEPKAVQRRVLKAIGERAGIPLEFKHIEEILRFAAADRPAGKELSLPLAWKVVREPEALVFVTPDLRQNQPVADYEYPLPLPGRIVVPEVGGVIEALRVAPDAWLAEYNSGQLLRADLLPERLTVRNWRAGDRFWPAHTKAPKKVKELLQEQHVAHPKRKLWPVAATGDEIVWMRGFPVPARFRAKAGQEAVVIREAAVIDEDTL